MADAAPAGAFRLRLEDPAGFHARDANTSAPVPATYVSPPIVGPPVLVEMPAESLLVGSEGALPPVVIIGTSDLTAMRATLNHPGGPGTARLLLSDLRVQLRDQGGGPLVPSTFLDRLRVLRDQIEIGINADPPSTGSSLPLPLANMLLEPGETVEIELEIDIKDTAPTSHLELWISGAGIGVVDATSGAGIQPWPLPGEELPLTSGVAQLMSPPRELEVSLESRLPTVLSADGNELGGDREYRPLPVGAAMTRLLAYLEGDLWADSGSLAPDHQVVEFVLGEPLLLGPGAPFELELRAILRESPAVGTFRIGLADSGVSVVQPASALLAIALEAAEGTFPIWTEAGSFSANTLEASYSNFPNPFAAGRETTAFVYYLPTPGQVTITIWSPRGEHVVTLVDQVSRSAGLHQSDHWDGRNGRGDLVISDVFLAELQVQYGSGDATRLLRKVAVVR
jgi:hypothetical protein